MRNVIRTGAPPLSTHTGVIRVKKAATDIPNNNDRTVEREHYSSYFVNLPTRSVTFPPYFDANTPPGT